MSISIKPLEDRIVIRQVEAEQTTASGLVIPDTAKEKPQEGEVIAVGPGRVDDNGNRIPVASGRRRRHLLALRRHRGQVRGPGVPDPVLRATSWRSWSADRALTHATRGGPEGILPAAPVSRPPRNAAAS